MPPVRYFGFKKETSFGTEATGSKYDITIAESVSLDVPDDPVIPLPTLSAFPRGQIAGYYANKGSFEYPIDIKTIGYLLYFGMGGYTFTSGTPNNTHEFYASQSKTLPSFTTRVGKDTFEHVFLGTVVNKMNVSVEDEVAVMKTDLLAKKDKKDNIRTTLNEPSGIFPIAFYKVNVSIGDTDKSPKIKSWELEYDNGIKEDSGRGFGSRFPYAFYTGDKSCSLTLKMKDDDSSILEAFWGDSSGASESSPATFQVVTTFDAGSAGTMTVTFPKCYYKKIDTSIKGAEPREPQVELGCLEDEVTLNDGTTKVTTPCYVKIVNSETSVST